MVSGSPVWSYKASWALSQLKANGEARNPTKGVWEITEAGRSRLTRESGNWALSSLQSSRTQVRREAPVPSPPEEPHRAPAAWEGLAAELPEGVFRALRDRLRLEAGPTPADGSGLSRNVILYGPPGTGKTYVAKLVAATLTGDAQPGPESTWRLVQFHPSYAYEDFVQGMKPDLEQTSLRYHLSRGPFLQICQAATDDPERFYVLLIDEINRGDPSRIFGELLYALEYRGQSVEPPLGGEVRVPSNLIVLGTMNSVDRSVALVDYALRRRFAFVRLAPDPEVVSQFWEPGGDAGALVLQKLNEWLGAQLDREHALGHSLVSAPSTWARIPRLSPSSWATARPSC